jgi:hypothetical protein
MGPYIKDVVSQTESHTDRHLTGFVIHH